MPPRRVVTPENLSLDFVINLDREDGPVGLNLDPAHFQRDSETGAVRLVHLPPESLDDLPDVDATLPTDGHFLAYDGETETWKPTALPEELTGAQIKTLYEDNDDTNAFTDAEKTKLAGLSNANFVGTFETLADLTDTHTTNAAGSYAFVDAGVGSEVQFYIWDESDEEWIAGSPSEETAGSIKTKYESNTNTNAFTDAEKTKLAGIEAGAQVNPTAAALVAAIDGNLGGSGWRAPIIAFNADIKTASYATVSDDFAGNKLIRMNVATANNFTVSPDMTKSEPVAVSQMGAGQTTIVAGTGVTLISAGGALKLRAQHSVATLMPLGSNSFLVSGDLTA